MITTTEPQAQRTTKLRTYREQDLPVLQGLVVDVGDAIREKPADALLEAVHGVERADDQCLFFAPVPHCREEDKRRLADRLENAEQCPDDDQTSEVLAQSRARQDGTPG